MQAIREAATWSGYSYHRCKGVFFVPFFSHVSNFEGVQKDINMLNGKLERSFFEICMAMKAKIRNKEPYVEHSMTLLRCIILHYRVFF